MRQYRGRRKDNGEWVYGWLVKDWDGGSHIVTEFGPDITHCWDCGANGQKSFKVDPKTVGQYTGLKDKNGREIYEGDIICHIPSAFDNNECIGEVFWFNGQARFALRGAQHYLDSLNSYEIISNIYENPELLKGEETA